MKRIEFAICDTNGNSLHAPSFIDDCAQLPIAIMRAVEDFLESNEGELQLPIVIRVQPDPSAPTC